MDEQQKKELETFVDKVMGETSLESPSPDFTEKLMAKIEAQSQQQVFVAQPLLPRKLLTVLFLGFVAGFVYLLMTYGLDPNQGWFKNIHWNLDFSNTWRWMEGYTASKVTLYAVLLFGVLFFVQIPWLKRYLDQHGTLS
ncbi:hypothetical protein F8C76_17315 [Flagellimonas olearia]|uniref:Uncharacterized protein n=1 Tax=Flagellimonas olearia TaxID=552546 RepID=A0A6I1DYC3_9FLAO|nr:hypothetical protein [Allomuricauda olearia]KAB7529569.1 hypothetical protein F8C76_17315 [Allomuricauda olearia]